MNKVREGYKETKIGEIPNEWIVDKLGNKAYIKARIGWKGLSSDEYTDEGPYLIAGKHIKGSKILWNECDHISIERYNESSEIMLKEKDIIMTKDGTIGRVGFIDKLNDKATINGTMMLIRGNEDLFYSKFLYYYFQGENFKRIINEKISGSSIPHIFQRDMVNLEVPIPSIYEQEKISSILSTVDEQIDNVGELIEKNKELKKGLMQQLLTKGIGHTKFKKTEIGEIPEEWSIEELGKIVEFSQGIQVSLEEQYEEYKKGYERFLRIIDYTQKSKEYRYIKYPGERYLVKNEDVVMVRYGATAGFVGTGLNGIIANNMFKITPIKEILTKEFLYIFLSQERVFSELNTATGASAMPAINFGIVSKLNIVIPSIFEQKKIALILSEVDEIIDEYENKKLKLEELKKGLMQQLLTGKIRVI